MATSAPSLANATATDRPMPLSPPVTNATLPASLFADRYLPCPRLRKRAELPAQYFQRLKIGAVNILRHLLLPDVADNPGLLNPDEHTYLDFRTRRFEVMFELAKKTVNNQSRIKLADIPQDRLPFRPDCGI